MADLRLFVLHSCCSTTVPRCRWQNTSETRCLASGPENGYSGASGSNPQIDFSPIVREIFAFQPFTAKKKQRIDRSFDNKLCYMVDRFKSFCKALADSLQHLHRYRNEAYHRNEVRPNTIRTPCLILSIPKPPFNQEWSRPDL